MKKIIAILLALVLCFSLAACGGDGDKTSGDTTPDEVKGETYDAGNVSALVPQGWKAFPVSDLFEEYDGDNDPTAVQICKGGESEWDIFTKPYLQINYYPDNSLYVSKDFYDDAADLEPMQLGGRTWNGFTATSMDYPMAILWTEGDVQIQVTVNLGTTDGTITINDADVQAIIASIQVK